jgi:hypothetical protein
VITLTFFLLLDGRGMVQRGTGRLPSEHRNRVQGVPTLPMAALMAFLDLIRLIGLTLGGLSVTVVVCWAPCSRSP